MSHVGRHDRIRVKSSPQVTGQLQPLLVDMCFCLVMSHVVFLHFAGDSHRVVSNEPYVARNLEVEQLEHTHNLKSQVLIHSSGFC